MWNSHVTWEDIDPNSKTWSTTQHGFSTIDRGGTGDEGEIAEVIKHQQ